MELPEGFVMHSPHRQKAYERCELLAFEDQLSGWERREASNSLIARLKGNAFALGAELVHSALKDKLDPADEAFKNGAVLKATDKFTRQFDFCVAQGIIFPEATYATVTQELQRVVAQYAVETPVRLWQAVTHVEELIPEYRCKPDLCGISPQGFHTVADIKYKSGLDSYRRESTIEEYRWDPQFIQYNAAWQTKVPLGEPVYTTLLLVLGRPFQVIQVPFLYTPEVLALWRSGAEGLTKEIIQIESGQRLPRPATVHRDNYGWCAMKDACFLYHWDEDLMQSSYVKLKGLPD